MGSKYDEVFNLSVGDPKGFWSEAARNVAWIKEWD